MDYTTRIETLEKELAEKIISAEFWIDRRELVKNNDILCFLAEEEVIAIGAEIEELEYKIEIEKDMKRIHS